MESTKRQIEVDGKVYGYWANDCGTDMSIRSETNPHKTPYLKTGSAQYRRVYEAIKAFDN